MLLGGGEGGREGGKGREYGLTARPLRLNSSLLYITRKGLEGGGIVDGSPLATKYLTPCDEIYNL